MAVVEEMFRSNPPAAVKPDKKVLRLPRFSRRLAVCAPVPCSTAVGIVTVVEEASNIAVEVGVPIATWPATSMVNGVWSEKVPSSFTRRANAPSPVALVVMLRAEPVLVLKFWMISAALSVELHTPPEDSVQLSANLPTAPVIELTSPPPKAVIDRLAYSILPE